MKRSYRLMVVDDEAANLQKLKRTFYRECQVHEADSGEAALTLLQNHRFDAIITDQRMPGISGVELLRASLTGSPEAIRIILTGYTDVDDLMDAINQGQVHRYVTKPWEPFHLKQTVLQDLELMELRRENQVLAEQLRIASEVQARLFPRRLPPMRCLEYTGMCRSAREVGGDYYDFLKFQDEQLWMAVGDISGKGISAALLMANLQGLLRSQAPLHRESLSELMSDVNRMLHNTTNDNKFASLFCALFDGHARTMHYVNAGHCRPILLRAVQNGRRKVDLLEPTGTLVGLFPDAVFEERSMSLEPGDVLLVHTDGVTEAMNRDEEEFGEDRLYQMANDVAESSPDEMCRLILEEVNGHIQEAEPSDDLTLVAARVLDG